MGVLVREVVGLRDLKRFVGFPFSLYRNSPYWVPPLIGDELKTLRSDRNPAFDFCEVRYWLAFREGRVVGRIAGIIHHRYIEIWGRRDARFGWIDFIDDEEVSGALLGTVERWARDRGMERLHGPLGFTDLDRQGMLVEGFEELGTFATIYNHPYYPRHLAALGYEKDADWVEYELITPPQIPEKLGRLAEIVIKRNRLEVLKVRRREELRRFAEEGFGVLNDAYRDLYAFVPLDKKQIDFYVDQFIGFVRPEFVPGFLDGEGRVAAFAIALPSLSKALQRAGGRLFPFGFIHLLRALRRNDLLDLYLIAVRPDLQGKGVNAPVMAQIVKAAIEWGIVKAETNIELETNTQVQSQWRLFEHRQHKRRRVFAKHLV